jgi:(p)ppGpp synthase/HD superfamily hydrolase
MCYLIYTICIIGAYCLYNVQHHVLLEKCIIYIKVETFFGRTVRNIVEGETKVSKLPKIALGNYADEQAENLRQMFIAMTEDYRIIIVKLCDRLHNMVCYYCFAHHRYVTAVCVSMYASGTSSISAR